MVEESKLIKADNKPTSQSAKTTIPRTILKHWNLSIGDTLLWELAILEGTEELVVIVRPEKTQKTKKVKIMS